MEVLTRVLDRGSFTAAGRDLGLTPAAVGNHIRALEQWLGARLLHRTTRRLALTEAGEAFLQSARRILEETEEAKATASALQATPRGVLRLSAPVSYGAKVLAALIADYLVEQPEMKIDVTLSDRRIDLLDEGFDLAIRIGELEDSSLIARRLARAPFVLCASPAYLKRSRKPRHPSDLASHVCLEYTLRLPKGRWTFTAPDGETITADVSGRLKATSGELLRAAAVRGLGLTLAPRFIVDADLETGALVPVLSAYRPPESGVYAVHPAGRRVPLKVRSFIDFLAKRTRRLEGRLRGS